MVARRAHNPKVVGSSPSPATIAEQVILVPFFFVKRKGKCEYDERSSFVVFLLL